MKKYSIDSVQYFRYEDRKTIFIHGWFALENHPFSRAEVWAGDRQIPFDLNRSSRPDVTVRYPEIISDQIGFFIRAELPEAEGGFRLVFDGEEIVSLSGRDLKYSEIHNPIVYTFDLTKENETDFSSTGFAKTLDGEPVSVEVLKNGKPFGVTVKSEQMPAIDPWFLKPDKQGGFSFILETDGDISSYSLLLSKDGYQTEIPLREQKGKISRRLFNARLLGLSKLYPIYKTNGLLFTARAALGTPPYTFRTRNAWINWYQENTPSEVDLAEQRKQVPEWKVQPKISVVTAAYNSDLGLLRVMIESLLNQTYPNWELCIADGSTDEKVRKYIKNWLEKEPRIKYRYLNGNKGISGNTNEALKMAEGDYIAFVDHDDELTPDAFYHVVKALQEKPYKFIYSDEDKIGGIGSKPRDPFFKPDFSLDYLLSSNYFNHLSVVRKDAMEQAGFLRPEFDGAQDYDFVLRVVENAKDGEVHHIPKVLYHWRLAENSTALNPENKLWAFEAGRKAVQDYVERNGIDAEVGHGNQLGWYTVDYHLKKQPLISIIIPNKDHSKDLDRLLASFENVTYQNYEILVVENNSEEPETFEYYEHRLPSYKNVKLLHWDKPFNYSAINNWAAKQAEGELLLLLNNDMEVIDPDFMEKMAANALRPGIGAVGIMLLLENGKIQHDGVLWGYEGGYHLFINEDPDSPSYGNVRMAQRNVLAVTGACLMVQKDHYFEVGGMNESYVVGYNDVDFCLKLYEAGYKNLILPQVKMHHFESLSRGMDDVRKNRDRFYDELDRLITEWRHKFPYGDPYYNPNLSLTRAFYTPRVSDEQIEYDMIDESRRKRDEERKHRAS